MAASTTFATWLQAHMAGREISNSRLMADLNVMYETVQGWRSGRRVPDAGACGRLAEALGCPVEEVLVAAGWSMES